MSEGYHPLALQDWRGGWTRMPVLSKICSVLQGNMRPQDLVSTIMTEPVMPEFDRDIQDLQVVTGAGS